LDYSAGVDASAEALVQLLPVTGGISVTRRIRVGVLFGGRSGEHAVSLMSARSIIAALRPEKYEVVPIGITTDGRWLVGGDPLAVLAGTEKAAKQTVHAVLRP